MLNENIRAIRKSKGLSQEELATLDRLQKKMLRNISALTQNHSKEDSKT